MESWLFDLNLIVVSLWRTRLRQLEKRGEKGGFGVRNLDCGHSEQEDSVPPVCTGRHLCRTDRDTDLESTLDRFHKTTCKNLCQLQSVPRLIICRGDAICNQDLVESGWSTA